jgi:hypothetical protein
MMTKTHRKKTAAMVGVALCSFTAPALAVPPPPSAVVDLGYTFIGLKPAQIEEGEGLEFLESDRRDMGFAITIGWRFTPHVAAEGTFFELGEGRYDVAVDDGGTLENATLGVRSSAVLLAVVGTWPIHDKLSVEGRAGAYLGKTETRVRGDRTGPLGSQSFNSLLGSDSSSGLAAGVAVVAAFTDTWGMRVGYDYLDKAFGENAGRISLGVRFNWP